MTWSPQENAAVLFGGLSPADSARKQYSLADTWEWNGADWVHIHPQTSPSKRSAAMMAYDSIQGRVILVGGYDGDTTYGDTWSYRNNEWTQLDTVGSPTTRRLSAMAFDPVRNVVVLYGGSRGTEILYDTWEFDGTAWRSVATSPQINSPSMVWDQARGEMLMLGLQDGSPVTLAYRDQTWVVLDNPDNPTCVGQVSMVFRTEDQRVLSYGGGCSNGLSATTWLWDGENWTDADVTATASLRYGYGLAYDPGRKETVLFGGVTDVESYITYVLDGNAWRRIFRFGDPGPRTQFVFLPEWTNERVLLYGGNSSLEFYGDLWSLEGRTWTRLVTDGQPPICDYPLGAIDSARERLVMVCQDSTTLEFDGEKWENITSSDYPLTRSFGMIAYDPNLQKTVLYGGFDGLRYVNQTWTWNGDEWTKVDTKKSERPDARILSAMFFDPQSDRIILLGGIGRPDDNSAFQRYDDQWSFDGRIWTRMTPANKPSQRYGAFTVWDPVNQRLLLYGGKDRNENYLGDLWEWNGTTWTQLAETNAPGPRMNGRMAFDPVSQSILFYGGYDGTYHSELWKLTGTSWELIPETPQRRRGVGRSH